MPRLVRRAVSPCSTQQARRSAIVAVMRCIADCLDEHKIFIPNWSPHYAARVHIVVYDGFARRPVQLGKSLTVISTQTLWGIDTDSSECIDTQLDNAIARRLVNGFWSLNRRAYSQIISTDLQ